jgi:hypothetical protein
MLNGTTSLFTIILYLNDGYEGGETDFLDENNIKFRVSHRGKTGSVLVFEQEELLHEGCELKSGEKYVVRTDVMFTDGTEGEAQEEEEDEEEGEAGDDLSKLTL